MSFEVTAKLYRSYFFLKIKFFFEVCVFLVFFGGYIKKSSFSCFSLHLCFVIYMYFFLLLRSSARISRWNCLTIWRWSAFFLADAGDIWSRELLVRGFWTIVFFSWFHGVESLAGEDGNPFLKTLYWGGQRSVMGLSRDRRASWWC